MQEQRHAKCPFCDEFTLQVQRHVHTMPHIPHAIVIFSLGLFVSPEAGLAWLGIWALHFAGNIRIGRSPWRCTGCGAAKR